MNTNLNPDFTFVVSHVQLFDLRSALRLFLHNLKIKNADVALDSAHLTEEELIAEIERLLNETEFDKTRLSNFETI